MTEKLGAFEEVTLTGDGSISVSVIRYGATITSVLAPDQNGELADVTLGFDDPGQYAGISPYFGAVVGRYANRIANARFTLDGKTFELARNEGPNCLHGGVIGFDKVPWHIAERDSDSVTLTHRSPHLDQGFPGTLHVSVTYTVTGDDELRVEYHALSDASTVVSLTQHTYWNLAGSGNVLGHELELRSSRITPVDEGLIPTGEIAEVAGTPFDFRTSTAIGARIRDTHPQLALGAGYDHNFVLDSGGGELALAARVRDPCSGRVLEVHTTEPGLQLYTGNRLDGSISGKGGLAYQRFAGLCIETQHFPDSPNHPQFPSTVLRPRDTYRSRTHYVFGVARN